MRETVFSILTFVWLAAAVGIAKPYYREWNRKHFALLAGALFVIMLIIVPPANDVANSSKSSEAGLDQTNTTGQALATSVEPPATPDQQYYDQLQREVKSLREAPRLADFKETREGIMLGIVLIGARIEILKKAPSELRPETKKLEGEFRQLQREFQRDLFPRLRRAQIEIWKNALWEHDIDVAAIGSRAETVKFRGGLFAANRNIAEAHKNSLETLQALRFKQDRYEWYRGSEYTYWDLEPLSDSDLATFSSSGNWTPISTK